MNNVGEHKNESRYQRYNRKHPTISIRLSRENYEMIRKMANGQALGTYCANALLNLHCNNCKVMLKKRGAQIQKFQDALKTIRTLQDKNEKLRENILKWQKYANGIKIERDQRDGFHKLQRKLTTYKKSNINLRAEVSELDNRNSELSDKVQTLEKVNNTSQRKITELHNHIADLQHKLDDWEARINALKGDKPDLLHNLVEEVGVDEFQILRDLIDYGLAHRGEIYVENLEIR